MSAPAGAGPGLARDQAKHINWKDAPHGED